MSDFFLDVYERKLNAIYDLLVFPFQNYLQKLDWIFSFRRQIKLCFPFIHILQITIFSWPIIKIKLGLDLFARFVIGIIIAFPYDCMYVYWIKSRPIIFCQTSSIKYEKWRADYLHNWTTLANGVKMKKVGSWGLPRGSPAGFGDLHFFHRNYSIIGYPSCISRMCQASRPDVWHHVMSTTMTWCR